MQSLNKNG